MSGDFKTIVSECESECSKINIDMSKILKRCSKLRAKSEMLLADEIFTDMAASKREASLLRENSRLASVVEGLVAHCCECDMYSWYDDKGDYEIRQALDTLHEYGRMELDGTGKGRFLSRRRR
jgi:hypothetical protein